MSAIKSRPIYPGLKVDGRARRHLVAAEGQGALAVIEAFAGWPEALAATTLIYTPGGSAGQDHESALEALGADALHVTPTQATAMTRLYGHLANAVMGTRLYVAGVEGFIGKVIAAGLEHGVDHQSIFTEHRGSLARRVQCVHCKGVTENVTATPFVCAHCGLNLFVRDHYSRRIAAFQGVVVDCEEPGVLPEREELYR